ncbi:hypothetical protein BDR07DRAFT_1423814 [Suillus spraguei]|nr:hypothetical protein BDR07DRAFT_1438403 [Suillus spraguei]KAG2356245.1 hypothetical protein BDR07DRAFT_1423814 [Suillus spraguei]
MACGKLWPIVKNAILKFMHASVGNSIDYYAYHLQFPLHLACAATFNGCQGLTLHKTVVDFRSLRTRSTLYSPFKDLSARQYAHHTYSIH